MELLDLYKAENKEVLYSLSWLNKNSIFDKSIGSFRDIDLFTFLENISQFDYEKDLFYDDVYYILEYTKDSIFHIMNNIHKEIKREYKILPLSQAKEFDHKTALWLSRQDGRTIKEKLKNNKIKTVKRYSNIDTYENRVFKLFLKKLVLIYDARDDLDDKNIGRLFDKIRQWLRSYDAKSIDEYKNIVYNNILLHHPHYSKIFKSYKWVNRLNEKIPDLIQKHPSQIKTIIKFEILTQLQFLTRKCILPNDLIYDINIYEIEEKNSFLGKNIDNIIEKIKDSELQNRLIFSSIRSFSKYTIEKQLNIKQNQNRFFELNGIQDDIFLDLFRLFPVYKLDDKKGSFPIVLKQKINEKIVNANNTKIIDLNNDFYTLPEILQTYDTNILKYFLDDLSRYFDNKSINYIIPDYVDIFKFSTTKKLINSYFKNSRNIPKSILAGLDYIFTHQVKENDTLIYIQKNHDNTLFVTPLLVRFDESLLDITNGLYIEKHPTKKLKDTSDILDELNNYFEPKISQKLLTKFLQNGLKGIKKEKVAFYLKDEIIYLDNKERLPKKKDSSRQSNIKKLFNNKKLFKSRYIEINDDKYKNLENFEILLNYEKQGHVLWKEHLPKLAMEIINKGYFDKFVLVDDTSKVLGKNIIINKKFIIPHGISKLSFPLFLDNNDIGFRAYVTSTQLPFAEDIECELHLTYDYERENPYELIFHPLNDSLSNIKVKWVKSKENIDKTLIYPAYPEWNDLKEDIEKSIVKELKRLFLRLELISQGRGNENRYVFLNTGRIKSFFSKYWQDGKSLSNSENNELKELISKIIQQVTKLQNKLPIELESNIYLFLSYLHEDLIVNIDTQFILKKFEKNEIQYGLSMGCLNREWQQTLLKNILKIPKWRQIIILNIAIWRCPDFIHKIDVINYIEFINYKLQNSSHESEKDIIVYLEFLLAALRTKSQSKILSPNKQITKNILNTLKSRSKDFVEHYELRSKINFGEINKPNNMSDMPDILYAVIYYLSNEDIENKIIIKEIKS